MTCPACGHENREGARFCDACGAALPAADAAAPAETVDGGRYQIGPLIGEGSRKCVYVARDTRQLRVFTAWNAAGKEGGASSAC